MTPLAYALWVVVAVTTQLMLALWGILARWLQTKPDAPAPALRLVLVVSALAEASLLLSHTLPLTLAGCFAKQLRRSGSGLNAGKTHDGGGSSSCSGHGSAEPEMEAAPSHAVAAHKKGPGDGFEPADTCGSGPIGSRSGDDFVGDGGCGSSEVAHCLAAVLAGPELLAPSSPRRQGDSAQQLLVWSQPMAPPQLHPQRGSGSLEQQQQHGIMAADVATIQSPWLGPAQGEHDPMQLGLMQEVPMKQAHAEPAAALCTMGPHPTGAAIELPFVGASAIVTSLHGAQGCGHSRHSGGTAERPAASADSLTPLGCHGNTSKQGQLPAPAFHGSSCSGSASCWRSLLSCLRPTPLSPTNSPRPMPAWHATLVRPEMPLRRGLSARFEGLQERRPVLYRHLALATLTVSFSATCGLQLCAPGFVDPSLVQLVGQFTAIGTALAQAVLLQHRLPWTIWPAAALMTGGACCVIIPNLGQSEAGSLGSAHGWLGFGLAVIALITTVVYFVVLQASRHLGYSAQQLQHYFLVFSILLFTALSLPVNGTGWRQQFGGWTAGDWLILAAESSVLYVGSATAMQYCVWRLGAPLTSMFMGLRLVFTAALSKPILGASIIRTWVQIAGIVLTAGSVTAYVGSQWWQSRRQTLLSKRSKALGQPSDP